MFRMFIQCLMKQLCLCVCYYHLMNNGFIEVPHKRKKLSPK